MISQHRGVGSKDLNDEPIGGLGGLACVAPNRGPCEERDTVLDTRLVRIDVLRTGDRVGLVILDLFRKAGLSMLLDQAIEFLGQLLFLFRKLSGQSFVGGLIVGRNRQWDMRNLAPDPRTIVAGCFGAMKDAGQGVVVSSRDRIEFVIVATGACERLSEECSADLIDLVVDHIGRELSFDIVLKRPRSDGQEAGSND